jgi:hypothetical protein
MKDAKLTDGDSDQRKYAVFGAVGAPAHELKHAPALFCGQ